MLLTTCSAVIITEVPNQGEFFPGEFPGLGELGLWIGRLMLFEY